MQATILNSWKEIAEYVGRGVRTVQRWEHDLGLPVRRPRHHLRSPVVAITTEIDEWLRHGVLNRTQRDRYSARAELRRLRSELESRVATIRQNVACMCQRVEELRQGRNVSARNNGTRAIPKA
jgi:hypothetical protein